MSGVRLTRRGRLVLRALPLFLVTVAGVQTLAGQAGAGSRAARRPSPSPTPTPTASPIPASSPATSATPTRRPSPAARATGAATSGTFAVASGRSAVYGSGPLRRFTVEVERGLAETPQAVAAAIERVLFDPRGWAGNGRVSFQRVDSGPVAFRVVLASAPTTDRLCSPLETNRIYSCYQHGRAVLNVVRWRGGATAYRGDLASYRVYMVNHEIGHALGHGHRMSCGSDGLAYVMIQQTRGLLGCRANPWPLADER